MPENKIQFQPGMSLSAFIERRWSNPTGLTALSVPSVVNASIPASSPTGDATGSARMSGADQRVLRNPFSCLLP